MAFLIDLYFRGLKFLVVLFIGSMVVLVLGNVILRYGFNSGITVSEELARWGFVWLTFTGAVIAMREHSHLGMDTVVSRLPVMGKKVCFVLSHLIMIYCVYLFADGSWKQTVINLGVEAPAQRRHVAGAAGRRSAVACERSPLAPHRCKVLRRHRGA